MNAIEQAFWDKTPVIVDEREFCPNCLHQLTGDETFCPECEEELQCTAQ